MRGGIALSLNDVQQTGDFLVVLFQGLGGTDVSGENAVMESGGEGVQSIVDGAHVDFGQHVLERLTRDESVGLGGWLVGCDDCSQSDQGHEEYLEEARAQHGQEC